ncbi:MAG: hypothetical protein ACRDTC_09325 [Pseudonocardiaceae bacterium]
MIDWIIQVCVDTGEPPTEQRLIELDDAAGKHDATVSRWAAGPGYTLTMNVQADDVTNAMLESRRITQRLSVDPLTVVDLRVTTPERFEAETLRPDFPPLASAADAAEILGVSRQRVHQLAASHTRFPAPVARVATGPLWTVPAIEHFARVRGQRPGRRHDSATVRPLRPMARNLGSVDSEREYREG